LASRRIALVVDDSDDTREMWAAALRLEGFAVEEAADGEEALRKATEHPPDIIVTDVVMPRMNGHETVRRLREDHRTCQIPVIVCSGEDPPSGTNYTPPDALLPKPCPLDLLLLEVRRLLRAVAAGQEPAPGADA
jgi:CheY-like chemotaxis protein